MRALKNISAALQIVVGSIAPTGRDQQCVSLCRLGGTNRFLHVRSAYFFPVALWDDGNSRRPQNELLNWQLIEPGRLAQIRKHRGQGQACSCVAAEDDSFFLVVFGAEEEFYGGRQ